VLVVGGWLGGVLWCVGVVVVFRVFLVCLVGFGGVCGVCGLAGELVVAYSFSRFTYLSIFFSVCVYYLLYTCCAADLEIVEKALVI
jgi:hypothetical protein